MQVESGSLQVGNDDVSACNGINAGEIIELQTAAWLMQACNGLLQMNYAIDTEYNARLQANNGGNSKSKGEILSLSKINKEEKYKHYR